MVATLVDKTMTTRKKKRKMMISSLVARLVLPVQVEQTV
jgi:hypothetical protein